MLLQEQVKKLPLTPGVYIFKSPAGKPLYVGRATSLRRRVSQYFRPDIDERIKEMVGLSTKIVHHKTDNVLDAVILEANLIKKFWPKYNIKDKDDRSFVYIVLAGVDYPTLHFVRGRELRQFPTMDGKKSARVFGPYSSLTTARNALKIIRHIIPYSTCRPPSAGELGKPCFEYQIGLCPGVCVGAISKADYQKNIKNLILILKGERKKLIKKLSRENPSASVALAHLQDVSLVNREELGSITDKIHRIEGFDISHFAGKDTYGSMVVFLGGEPDKSQYRLFKIKNAPANNDLEALKEVVARRFKHEEWPRPDLILIDGGRPQVSYIDNFFKTIRVAIPMLGISKLQNDKLIFPIKTKDTFKNLSETIKDVLVKTRDEAHRFAIRAHRNKRDKLLF